MMTNVVDCEFDELRDRHGRSRRCSTRRRTRSRSSSSGPRADGVADADGHDWSFPFEEPLHDVFPALHDAQSSWLSQIDSLPAPDRKTHELIRLVCTVILRNPAGIVRHAQLAREVGADVGRGARLDHAHRPRRSGCSPRSRRSRVAREGFDAAPKPGGRLTMADATEAERRRSASCRELTDLNRDFWTGGEQGELRFLRCQDCGYYIHPPHAALPDLPLEEPRSRGGVGAGDARAPTRSTTSPGCRARSCRSSSRSSRSPSRTACGSRPTS